uniref:Bromo domain-containing protein n=1 Tax=Mucochytrium quahogii TaxID=96639 RepID=A0A7S2W4Q7_9STRA|mmetsp:Transcript_10103/g.16540  ORF Transcript_10103/g.16540 Transcript_10103/m.16540 type:complete len:546 (+) Transcript_10103:109-1746(+)
MEDLAPGGLPVGVAGSSFATSVPEKATHGPGATVVGATSVPVVDAPLVASGGETMTQGVGKSVPTKGGVNGDELSSSVTQEGDDDRKPESSLDRTGSDLRKKKPKRLKTTWFYCDSCKVGPLHVRWHCSICGDFDLCSVCYTSAEPKHMPVGHIYSMVKIEQQPIPAKFVKAKKLSGNIDEPEVEEEKKKILPRRASTITGLVAGADMDRMNDLLIRCAIGKLGPGNQSTKIAQDFLHIFSEVGWPVFKKLEPGADGLLCEQAIIAMSLALVGVHVNKTFERCILPRPLTPKLMYSLMVTLTAQLADMDKDGFFCHPVPKTEPEYHERIKQPMDLGTLDSILRRHGYPVATTPHEIFLRTVKDIQLIWSNAMEFNPVKHDVHQLAEKNANLTTQVFLQLSRRLQLEIEPSRLEFLRPASVSQPPPLARVPSGGNGVKNIKKRSGSDSSFEVDIYEDEETAQQMRKKQKASIPPLQTQNSVDFRQLSPLASSSPVAVLTQREAELQKQVNALRAELQNAHARVNKLVDTVEIGLTKMLSKVASLKK